MLQFFGISNTSQGEPERYQYQVSFKKSLHACLHLFEALQKDHKAIFAVLRNGLDEHLQDKEFAKSAPKEFRSITAQLLRTKDMANFFISNADSLALKLKIGHFLNQPSGIEEKWEKIEALFLEALANFEGEEAAEQLGDTNSEFFLSLQWIALSFLEDDAERPPVNLQMEFIPRAFPQVKWKKKEGFHNLSDPFWTPKNPLCRSHYLSHRLMSKLYQKSQQSLAVLAPEEQSIFQMILPKGQPDYISLELPEHTHDQLSLLPETPAESLLILQRMVQQKYSFDGVRHLMGIFRQLGTAKSSHYRFSIQAHYELLGLTLRGKQPTSKQVEIFHDILNLLEKINVKRRYNQTERITEKKTAFLSRLGSSSTGLCEIANSYDLLIDPICQPSRENPFRLGAHLNLIHQDAFQESPTKHNLLTSLASYFTGSWLLEYPQKKGTLKRTAEEIIDGCAIRVTAQAKKGILGKLHSELAYMQQKRYIGALEQHASSSKNPWEDQFIISAPEPMMRFLQDGYNGTTQQIA